MRRVRWLALFGAVAALWWLPRAASAFSVSYDQKVTMRGQVMTSKVLFKDDQFRIETDMGGTRAYIIKNRNGIYQYLPSQGVAMSLESLGPGMGPVQHPDDYLGYLKERNAKHLRTETVNGHLCDVYEFDDPSSRGVTTVWVQQDTRFPVKMEIDGAEGRVTAEISNLVLGAGIQDAVFQLPAGVEMVSMGQMMQGVSDLLERRSP